MPRKNYPRKLDCMCELQNAVWFSGQSRELEASLFTIGSPKEFGRLQLNSLSAFHRLQGNPLSVGLMTTRWLLRSVWVHTTRRQNRWLNIIRNEGSILALMQQSPRMLSFVMYWGNLNELSKELGNFFELIIQVQLLKSVGMSVNQQGMHLNLTNWLQKKYLVFGNCT